jgi:hypothetical protein
MPWWLSPAIGAGGTRICATGGGLQWPLELLLRCDDADPTFFASGEARSSRSHAARSVGGRLRHRVDNQHVDGHALLCKA